MYVDLSFNRIYGQEIQKNRREYVKRMINKTLLDEYVQNLPFLLSFEKHQDFYKLFGQREKVGLK